jgi:hypothetical protein
VNCAEGFIKAGTTVSFDLLKLNSAVWKKEKAAFSIVLKKSSPKAEEDYINLRAQTFLCTGDAKQKYAKQNQRKRNASFYRMAYARA